MSSPLATTGKGVLGIVGRGLKNPLVWLGAGAGYAMRYIPKIGPKLPLAVKLAPLVMVVLFEVGDQMVEESKTDA